MEQDLAKETGAPVSHIAQGKPQLETLEKFADKVTVGGSRLPAADNKD
jgi:hypothetical protein